LGEVVELGYGIDDLRHYAAFEFGYTASDKKLPAHMITAQLVVELANQRGSFSLWILGTIILFVTSHSLGSFMLVMFGG